MQDKLPDTTFAAKQVELAINNLDSLTTLDCIAAQYLPKIIQSHFQPSILTDIIESDPALATRFLSLISSRGINIPDGRFSFANLLDKLTVNEVRNTILSIKVMPTSDQTNNENEHKNKKGLFIHSLAVACCAKDIAELAIPQMDSQLAYCAGLLHDIGKLAIEETMPKSFTLITKQAQSLKQCSRVIEQEHLYIDHTVIGKRLAQKWQLPNLIVLAIWLHHNQTITICSDMPEARIAAVVQLADSLARQSNIGLSGSFDTPKPAQPIADILNINSEQLQLIHHNLNAAVEGKIKLLGLNLPKAQTEYNKAIQTIAAQFANRDAELSDENRLLQSASSHLDFIKDFILNISPNNSVINIAENLASRWQKFYQTGKVCLYLAPSLSSQILEVVVVENLSQSEILYINAPVETSAIPKALINQFTILSAQGHVDWLFEQLNVDFDINRMKLVPLLSGSKAIGIIAFELNYPSDLKLFEEKFKISASVAGSILGMALEQRKEQHFAEHFAELFSITPEPTPTLPEETQSIRDSTEITMEDSLDALAEMAAGAAHELNNPLAVISGRAQLLAEDEGNQEKKQILEQIQKNANEASEIIEDLMSFAEPPQPKPTTTKIPQMIDEAIQLAGRKTDIEKLNIQIEIDDGIKNVFVDSAQIVSAIANIISNAIESYKTGIGLIRISAENDKTADLVKLTITDSGCGMDAVTLKKAIQPFFSVKEAGRKRGMGLAYAARLIQINKGSLSISSQPGEGTTVNIYLPSK